MEPLQDINNSGRRIEVMMIASVMHIAGSGLSLVENAMFRGQYLDIRQITNERLTRGRAHVVIFGLSHAYVRTVKDCEARYVRKPQSKARDSMFRNSNFEPN